MPCPSPRPSAPRTKRDGLRFGPYLLASLFALALACLASGLAPLTSHAAGAPAADRTLSLQERVAYQRAVEEVYWRRTLWPEQNARPKPSLDEVVPVDATRAKVEETLRKSDALARRWNRPVAPEQLQAELTRMARETRQPEVLRELWRALGDDPFVIAEVLARPALVDRLARNSFAADEKADDAAGGSFDSWWAARRQQHAAEVPGDEGFAYRLAAVNEAGADDTWEPTQTLPISTGTIVWTGAEVIIWGGGTSLGGRTDQGSRYNPATDTWASTSTVGAPQVRADHTAVWTGTEMIVWGGCNQLTSFCGINDGARYNPVTDTWTPTSTTNAPAGRRWHTAVWTGSKMIVWGGCSPGSNGSCASPRTLNSGGVYDPANDSWTLTTLTNAPSARSSHRAVWTGTEMMIWGSSNTGGLYNPNTDTWRATSTFNAPSARAGFTMVWTGTEAVVWGGYEGNFVTLNTGARYNPQTDTWTPTSRVNSAAARFGHTAVWTGTEMIVYGGDLRPAENIDQITNTGGRYNPANDTWTQTSTAGAPVKHNHVAVWTGEEMFVWGGRNISLTIFREAARYKPATDSWIPTNNNDSVPSAKLGVWTGAELLVWGKAPACNSGCGSTGGRYDPATNFWRPMNVTNAPSGDAADAATAVWTGKEMIVAGGRYNPANDIWTRVSTVGAPFNINAPAVWTGTEVLVWGGDPTPENSPANAGGRYNPANDTWRLMSTDGAPAARGMHTAVWTGTEMIVWGGSGYFSGSQMNTGGRYNPANDTWRPTSTTGAPEARLYNTAVWTGAEMVVWGGWVYSNDGTSRYLDTGARYNPANDSWTPTSAVGAPSARSHHRAVWTGSQMIVWGGLVPVTWTSTGDPVYTGARYNPASDIWTPTSLRGAPSRRHSHVQVWTGTRMIVWGGTAPSGAPTQDGGVYNAPGAVAEGNQPPSVRIESPAEGSGFQSGDTVNINVAASDTDGTVTTVRFYANGTLVGTDTQAPFGFAWGEVRGGSYALVATATDDSGGEARSASVGITVAPSTAPPVCTLTNPADGTAYAYGATVRMDAAASANRDRTITKVEFIDNGVAVSSYPTPPYYPPYTFGYLSPASGTHNLAARCTDNTGAASVSPVKVVTVSSNVHTISGQVLDDRGFIVEGIRVRLDGPAGTTPRYATTTVQNNGNYIFSNLEAGASYTVTPEPGAWSFSPTSRSYPSLGGDMSSQNFIGVRVGYGIAGRVTDPAGNPVYPATINLSGSKVATTGTDVNGNYFFSNLTPGGTYTLQPYKNGYAFTPPTRTFSNLSAEQTADFTAAPETTPTTPVNVALAANGGAVTVSSAYDSRFPAASLNNGDRKGLNWAAGGGWNDATSNSYPDWVEVTFGGAKTISEVDVFTVQDNFAAPLEPTEAMTFTKYGVTAFEIRYWTGAAWATVPNGTSTANSGVWRRLTFAPLTTDRIRVVVTGALDGYSRLTEVEVWQGAPATTTGRVNVALASQGATASSSSQHSAGYPASAAINGDRRGLSWGAGGGWNDGTSNAYPDWLEVTFSGAKTIDEVSVFTLQDALSSPVEPNETTAFTKYGVTRFDVQYWTGSAWATLPGGAVTGNNKVWRKLTFAPVTTTKIRVLVTGALDASSRLVEVEAWQAQVAARTNHALAANGGLVTVSSAYDSRFPAASLNNGDRKGLNWAASGGWNDATSNSYPDWVEVTFGGAKTVSEVSVFTVQDAFSSPAEPTEGMTFTKYGVTQFDVQAWDGAQWATVAGGAVTGNNLVWRKLTFAPITTTKVRVLVRGALDGYSRLAEVEAY